MATAKALRQKINEEFLTCQICLNVYTEPTLLDCQHTFCRTCVEQCVQVIGGGVHCPVCRQRTLVPRKQGVNTLRKNFYIQSLIDSIGHQSNQNAFLTLQNQDGKFTRNRQQFCDTCDDHQCAVKRCLDCCDFLCADCFLIHRHTKFTKGHKIVGIGSLRTGKYVDEIQTRAKIVCKTHDAEICKLYCQDCRLPACQECYGTKCQDHSVVQIKVAIDKAKEDCAIALKKGEEAVTNVYEWLNEIATAKRKRRNDKESICQLIDDRVKKIIQNVKQQGRKMSEWSALLTKDNIQATKEVFNEQNSRLDSLERKGKKTLDAIKSIHEDLKDENDIVLQGGDPEELLGLREKVDKLNVLLQRGCGLESINKQWLEEESCVTLKINEIGKFGTNLIGKITFKDYMIADSSIISDGGSGAEKDRSSSSESEILIDSTTLPVIQKKVKPKKLKKLSSESNILDLNGSESPSMGLRRTFCDVNNDFSSNENLDGNVFEDSGSSGNNEAPSSSKCDIRTRHSSVRRSKSLASLCDYTSGTRRPQVPPKPLPRKSKRNESCGAPSVRPRSMGIDPNSLLRQPVRHKSSENLTSVLQRRAVTQGKVVIQFFDVCGQTCRFTSAPKIAALPNGNIVATDFKTQKVYRFSEDGVILNSFKVGSNGKDVHPIGLATTKKGKIVVTCGETVRILAPNGKSSRKFGNGMFGKCCGIACDNKTNRIAVSDIEKRCLSIHSSDGTLERTFSGSTGSYSSVSSLDDTISLQTPYFIAIDQRNGNIIASDWSNHEVKIYDKEGNCLQCITQCYTKENGTIVGFLNPAGVCCDEEGNIYIADHGHNRIAMFSNNWEFQRFVATEANNLRSPWSITIHKRGSLLVSEYWTKLVKEFSYS